MRLTNEKYNGYIWNCNLIYDIGKLEAKSSTSIKLNIIPYQTGLLVIFIIKFFNYYNLLNVVLKSLCQG